MALSKLKTEEVNEAHATHDDECGGAGECHERTGDGRSRAAEMLSVGWIYRAV